MPSSDDVTETDCSQGISTSPIDFDLLSSSWDLRTVTVPPLPPSATDEQLPMSLNGHLFSSVTALHFPSTLISKRNVLFQKASKHKAKHSRSESQLNRCRHSCCV